MPGSLLRAAPALWRHGGELLVEELIRAAVSLHAGVERNGNGCPGRVLETVLQTQGLKTVP